MQKHEHRFKYSTHISFNTDRKILWKNFKMFRSMLIQAKKPFNFSAFTSGFSTKPAIFYKLRGKISIWIEVMFEHLVLTKTRMKIIFLQMSTMLKLLGHWWVILLRYRLVWNQLQSEHKIQHWSSEFFFIQSNWMCTQYRGAIKLRFDLNFKFHLTCEQMIVFRNEFYCPKPKFRPFK